MPELPEVETVCSGLRQSILGRKFLEVKQMRPNLRIEFPKNFSQTLQDKTITAINRRGKYILISLNDDNILIVHLGMSGKFVVYSAFRNNIEKHDHAIFKLDDGKELVFNDPRRFGLITIANQNNVNQNKFIANLGVEPLEDEFNTDLLLALVKNKTTNIKNLIMNANLIVGVGNIYACESLYNSAILPQRKSCTLTKQEADLLVSQIKIVLKEAIKAGGSTLKDYVKSSGEAGYFQHNFKVYGRENDSCFVCSNKIKRIVQSGRSTFYCEYCQK